MDPHLWPLRVTGAGLLVATAAIHLDLYVTGYRTIPTIGCCSCSRSSRDSRSRSPCWSPRSVARSTPLPGAAAAALGAGFAIATLGGYLLSLWVGLFGFSEIRTTAGIVAGLLEIAAFAVLASLVFDPPAGRRGCPRAGAGPTDCAGGLPAVAVA